MIRFLLLLSVVAGCADGDVAPEDVCADPSTTEPGTICTVVGRIGFAKLADEGLPAVESELYLPIDVTVGPDGLLYVIDWNNHRVRVRAEDGTMHTIAGSGSLGDGPEGEARYADFNHPTNIKFHPDDPDMLYIAAWHNSRIEKIDLVTEQLTFESGDGDRAYGGDGGPAKDAVLDLPSGIVFDDDGSIYLSDTANQIIRRIDADGMISAYAGTPPPGLLPNGQTDRIFGWEGDGGPANLAKFNFGWGQRGYPGGRIERVDRKLYMTDTYNFVIRVIDLDTGIIDHVAGTGLVPGYEGDGGPAAEAKLDFPSDIAADEDGNLYVADTFNHCIRKIAVDGIITTVAGVCTVPGGDGDGGPATEAHLLRPFGVEVGGGFLYVSDSENHVIRAVKL
jgi:sugar lactone lactonase YvrE